MMGVNFTFGLMLLLKTILIHMLTTNQFSVEYIIHLIACYCRMCLHAGLSEHQ